MDRLGSNFRSRPRCLTASVSRRDRTQSTRNPIPRRSHPSAPPVAQQSVRRVRPKSRFAAHPPRAAAGQGGHRLSVDHQQKVSRRTSRCTARIGQNAPLPTALPVPDAAAAPVQQHCREQRTDSGRCGSYRTPAPPSCRSIGRPAGLGPRGRRARRLSDTQLAARARTHGRSAGRR